jgi:hypothetical protein
VDDAAAAHFVGTELHAVVSAEPRATAYRVELHEGRVVESPVEARQL